MMKYCSIVAVWCASLLACGNHAESAGDRDAILRLYEAQRAAHFLRDAEMFLGAVDTGYLAIGDGMVQYRPKADALKAVADYFQQTRIEQVQDVSPPRVKLATDRRAAWLIGEVEVRGMRRDSTGTERPFAFRAAWLDVYEKGPLGWRLTARANTQRQSP